MWSMSARCTAARNAASPWQWKQARCVRPGGVRGIKLPMERLAFVACCACGSLGSERERPERRAPQSASDLNASRVFGGVRCEPDKVSRP